MKKTFIIIVGMMFSTPAWPQNFIIPVPPSAVSVSVVCLAGGNATQNGPVLTCPQVGPPPPIDPCTGGTGKTLVIKMDWNSSDRVLTSSYGGFAWNDMLILEFTTGPSASVPSNLPRITGVEYQGAQADRKAIMSNKRCSFDTTPPASPQSWPGASSTGAVVTIPFTVLSQNYDYYPLLQPNTTYYVNVKNLTCTAGTTCDMAWVLSHPGTP